LVLLIVFMVTAPLLTVGVEVDLPKTKAGAINADAAPLVVSIKADGSLFLQDAGVEPAALVPRLKAISNANPDIRIFVRSDKSVTYGKVLGVMGRIQAAGFEKVALVARLPEAK
jgi:biopolymer transport protein TolR